MRSIPTIQKCESSAVLLRHFLDERFPKTFLRLSLFLIFFVLFVPCLVGKAAYAQAPNYTYNSTASKNLDNFSITTSDVFNPQAKINRIIIAVAVGPDGEPYVLTFGNGIKKISPNGGLVDFIPNTGDRLSNSMDLAINSEGKFFVATNESNRRFIRVYSSNGTYLSNETLGDGSYGTGANQFKGPVGLAFDNNDNLYVADHYLGDANPPPPRPSSIKIYRKDAAGNYKNNLITEFDNIAGTLLNFPYRIAVNSRNQLYMSELGSDNTAKVKIIQLNANLTPSGVTNGPTANLGAPGSIIIDKFDYIYIADFGNDIDLPRLLAATGDVDEFYTVFEIIKQGIQNDVFNINVYNLDNSFRSKISTGLDFIIDLSVSECGTLFVNNAIFAGQIRKIFGILVPDITMDFDLEVFDRSSSYDTESPQLITCPGDQEEEFNDGSFQLPNYKSLAEFTDNCDDDLELVQNPPENSTITTTTTVTIFARDDSGNKSEECSFLVKVENTPDTTDPVFTNCPSTNLGFSNELGVCGAKVNYEIPIATDDSGAEPTVIWLSGPKPGEFVAVGETKTVIYRATDGAENSTDCSFTVTVSDDEAPDKISCPSNLAFEVSFGETGRVVNYQEPIFDDNCEVQKKELSSGLLSGEFFPLGVTTVSYIATDASANNTTCSFTVSITEAAAPEPPEAICKDLTVPLDQNGVAAISAADVYGGTNVSLTLDIDVLNFGCSDLGVKPVVLTVTDPATGLSDSCTAQITIVDNNPPVVNCVAPFKLTLDSDGSASLTVDDIDNSSSDNCSIASRTLSQYSFTSADKGIVPVTLTITDNAGQFTTCTVNVTIEAAAGPEPPEALCKNFTVPLDQNGVATITAAEVYGGTNTSLTLGIDIFTFGCSDLGVKPVVLTVTDPATGLSDTCKAQITVVDNLQPQFTCPSDQTISLGAGEEYIIPNFEEIINPSDNCHFTVIQNPPPGAALTNSQRIEIHVIDFSGNDTWCSFVISVDPGTVECKPTDLFLTQSGDNTVDPRELYKGDVNDPLIKRFSVDREYFTCEDLGPQPVILTVHFKDGSTQKCSTEVVVKDAINPEVFCVAPGKEFTLSNGSVTIDVNDLVAGLDDNCGVLNYWLSQETFTSAGTKSVTINAEDASGLLGTCKTTIEIVEPSTTPGACKAATVYLDETGSATLDPEEVLDGDPNSGSIESMSLSRNSFTCDDLQTAVEVELTVNYSDGSSTTCTTSVIVKDDIDPVAVCVEEFTLHLNENGVGRIMPEILDRGSSDNCDFTMSLSKENFDLDDLGEQDVILTVTDASGNTSACTTKVTVEAYDEENPGINCVDELSLPLSQTGDFILRLNYTGEDENEDYTLSQDTFSCEDLGTQFITVTYWGEYTGTCEIKVTVVDDLAPVIDCRDDIELRLNASGKASISREDLDLEFSDNCSVAETSLSSLDFTTADVGENQISFTVTDGSGNISTCTTTVTVLAFDEPEPDPIQCVDLHVLQIDANGQAILNPRDLFTGGTGSTQFTVSKDSFSCLDIGENTVTFEYSTPNESGSCEIKVMVEDPSGACEEPVDPSTRDYIILYPNPSLGVVRFQTSPGLEIHRVEVFDMRGRYLFEKVYDQNSIFDRKLDLQEYQSGVYTLLLYTNGKEYLKRAIIRN